VTDAPPAERWVVDSRPSERYSLYTRANAGEVMPDPISPLTADLAMLAAGEAG
jgi:rifampicin phosphotransferase